MYCIDSHAHLNDPAFDEDRTALIKSFPAHQLAASIEIGCAPAEWQPALDLSTQFQNSIFPVLGVHPEYAPQVEPYHLEQLQTFLHNPLVKAVGEIGLDYTCLDVANKNLQQTIFTQMLTCANEAQKPLVLHVRRPGEDFSVYTDCFAQIKHNWKGVSNTAYPGVLHCFCARYEEAVQALDNGFLLGINGCFTYKKNEYIREAVKKAGADKLVLETDCPYLSPQGKRGTRNDPRNIPLIAQFVADYLNMPLEELAQITMSNTKKLYGLD